MEICVVLYGDLRGFVWKSAWGTPKGQVHCSEEPKWWWELRGFDKLLGALIGFVGRVYNPWKWFIQHGNQILVIFYEKEC